MYFKKRVFFIKYLFQCVFQLSWLDEYLYVFARQVTLLEPVIKHPEKYDRSKPTRLNKHNNIEWEVDVGPGETKELSLKYNVEHPNTEEVEASILHMAKSHEV